MKSIMAMLMLFALVLGLAGCNTVKGIGKDIEKGGEAIQKAAT
ncbi:entericidin A/B family lipoprotein [Leeia sp. TBRC 13508]|uniref:Entericidin A/B family lipoprotein n=1 Tax=Leeia speluncae TaxID=2884804 RepID=A0ABS8DAL0_9NEIS|nr:entericidin A/B family lipoprotein [Leeia speluncae]MCB6185245.1 entericidin A/B family lipoprotein [Leeia speluncae]